MIRSLVSLCALTAVTAVAAAGPSDPGDHATALVVHVPPGSAKAGAPIALTAMLDAPLAETLVVHWRRIGERTYADAVLERSSAGGWYAEIPGSPAPGVEYYIAGTSADGAEIDHFASAAAPHVVRIDPTPADRLEAADRVRLRDRLDRVGFDVDGHDFGNRYGELDRFVRAETSFTHHVGGTLYELVFGFGLIEGATPVYTMSTGMDHVIHGARYGFSGVRLRLADSIFVDGRISLGVSHAGFSTGTSGAVTLGKPWRSNVSFGGEYMQDLGPSLFVRLQWDTASPLLMAASVIRTDLPGALISEDGVYVKYEVMYNAFARTTLRGSLSFGGRDGPAHFGGGLGASVAF